MTFIEGVKELSRAWLDERDRGSYTIIIRKSGSLWDVESVYSGPRGMGPEQLALKLTLRKAVNLAFEKKAELSRECYAQITLLEK